MSRLTLLFFYITISFTAYSSKMETFLNKTNLFLSEYTDTGSANYKSISSNNERLKELIHLIETIQVKDSSNQQLCFWLNSYNLLSIYTVSKHPHTKSILEIDHFYTKETYNVGGEKLNLLGLRNIIIKKYPDPRVFFLLSDGAIGSPQIAKKAYTPKNITSELNKKTKTGVNSHTFVRLKPASKTFLVSASLKPFFDTINFNEVEKIAFINTYINSRHKISPDWKVGYFPVNWDLKK